VSVRPLRVLIVAAVAVAVVLAVLVLASVALGVVGQLSADQPTSATRPRPAPTRTSPELPPVRPCATVWPPTCPERRLPPVRPCATIWPPTCNHSDRPRSRQGAAAGTGGGR
jgi:hypothetical protein